MDVRIKFGKYSGEVRDIEPLAARAMLADGRAELPCIDRDPASQPRATAEDYGELARLADHDDCGRRSAKKKSKR